MKITSKAPLIALVLVFAGLASCRTTEANYRAAYEATKSARAAADGAEDDLDENTRRLLAADQKHRQSKHVVGTDTLQVVTLFGKLEEGAVDRLPQYAVVANAFSQVFNAKALCKRLQEAGFSGAFIMRTATPDYYVAAGGSDDIAAIPALRDSLAAAGNPGSRAGFPAIVRIANTKPKSVSKP